jgi:hypothetical protein
VLAYSLKDFRSVIVIEPKKNKEPILFLHWLTKEGKTFEDCMKSEESVDSSSFLIIGTNKNLGISPVSNLVLPFKWEFKIETKATIAKIRLMKHRSKGKRCNTLEIN